MTLSIPVLGLAPPFYFQDGVFIHRIRAFSPPRVQDKKGGGATAGVMGSARAGEKSIAITGGEVQEQERRETSADREIEKQERRVCQSRRVGGMKE
jgi:hypothetical protein